MDLNNIECPICGGKGFTYEPDGIRRCVCLDKRNTMRRLEKSGLAKSVARYTFDSYYAREPWQQCIKETVMKYADVGAKEGKWLYIGGQAGTGKTHLATAALGKLAETMDVRYCPWTIDAQHIKCVITDYVKYDEVLTPLQTADALFIDDMFKPVRGKDGESQMATAADIRVAFDILNYRYINDLPTIISSEWYIREIDAVDEAVASRIYEKCGEYRVGIKRDISRNYRYRNDTII